MAKKSTWEIIGPGGGEKLNKRKLSKVREQTVKEESLVLSAPTERFTEDDLAVIEESKGLIDFSDTSGMILYWSDVSWDISAMTEKILSDKKLWSLRTIWWELSDLIVCLNTWESTRKKWWGLVQRVKKNVLRAKANRIDASEVIEKLETLIQESWEKVDGYIPELDGLRDGNIELIKRLKLLVEAWKQRIAEEKDERERLEQEYLENDGVIDEREQSNLNVRKGNIEQFIQRINDLERVALVALTNIAQINLIRDAAVSTKTKMLQLQETAIPAIRMQTAVSTMASEVADINDMGKAISDKVQTILVESAKMTRDLAVSSATEAQRPVVEDKTFQQVVGILTKTQEDVRKICEEWERKLLQWNRDLRDQLAKLSVPTTRKQIWHKK